MKVAVIGPQNTGKSTFVSDLLVALPDFSTPAETYRDVIRAKNLDINQKTTTESQRFIRDFLYEQVKNAPDNTIFDRCVIDNYMYTRYAASIGSIDAEFVEETKALMIESLPWIGAYLFIPTALSVSLVEDELRDTTASYIDASNRIMIETLMELVRDFHIKVAVVGGAREERVTASRKFLGL